MRALLAVAGTAFAIVLVLGYRTPSFPTLAQSDEVVEAQPPAEGGACDPDDDIPVRVYGSRENWGNGQLRVEATVVACRIEALDTVDWQTTNTVSERRSRGAVAMLHSAALTAQCADVDTVSGATFTSEAYSRSLQALIDTTNAGQPC
jgi:uncharacterized protein with FMN-binding domain